jgi:hypothetical protein
MNPQLRLLTPIEMIMGTIGIGSFAIANLTPHHSQNLTLAQNHEGMNHNMDVGPADTN